MTDQPLDYDDDMDEVEVVTDEDGPEFEDADDQDGDA
jgi:hypothetical protein